LENIGTLRAELMLEAKQFKQKMNETKEEIKGLSKSADEESKKMNKSFTAINQSLENMGLNSNQISKINDQIKKVRPKDLEKELQLVRKELTAMGLSANEIDKITKEMMKAEQASHGLVIGMNHIQTASLAVITAVGAVYGASIPLAATFEQKMADIKAISETTGDEMDSLTQLAQEMGEKTAFSATEAAAGIEELIKAGVSVETIINGGLESSLNLAVAGGLQLAEAAEIASTSLNAFRDDNLKASNSANILAGAANASATDVREMQYGLSQVSAVASGVGMSFQDTATALAVFAQNGLKGSDSGTSLKTMLSNLQPTTKDQIRLFKELGLMTQNGQNAFFDLNGELKGIDEIAGLLQTSMKDLTDQQRSLALETIFGSDAVRAGNILFKEGEQGIRNMWQAMSQVTAAEVAATKVDTLNGAFNEFTSVLETAGIQIGEDFLPLLTDIVRYSTDVMRSLNDMNGVNLKAGLAFAGTAAAVALVISTISKLALAVRTLYVSMGPAGWLITGVSLLAGAFVSAKVYQDEYNEVTLDSVIALDEQRTALSNNIAEYDKLKSQSKLSNDELMRFVDINSEISKTADPNVIAALKEEQIKLQEKSGLTNEQLQRMVDLNGSIIDTVPESNTVLSDQGNVLLENTDAAKEFNAQQAEMIRLELDAAKTKLEANMSEYLEDERRIQQDIVDLKKEMADLDTEEIDQTIKVNSLKQQYAEAKRDNDTGEMDRLFQTIAMEENKLEAIKKQKADSAELVLEKAKELDKIQQQIGKLDEVNRKMIDLELKQVGINAKRGEEVAILDDSIQKLEGQKQKLIETTPVNLRNTEEFRTAKEEIEKQITSLQRVKDKILEITGQASIMNYELGREIQKNVITNQIEYLTQVRKSALPTGPQEQKHTGGIVGRGQMPTLHVGGLASQFATSPMHNEVDVRLLRNEWVFTEAQQANLFRMIDAGFTTKTPSENEEKKVNYDIDIHTQNVDMDEKQLVKVLQRLEVLHGR
jgi:TP901 family phage tail tape measure protein